MAAVVAMATMAQKAVSQFVTFCIGESLPAASMLLLDL